MFGSEMLEVAIGLSFIFLFASLVCSAMREGIEGFMKLRAQNLEQWIRENLSDGTKQTPSAGSEIILGGEGAAKGITLAGFYEHSLIYPLFSGEYDRATGRVSSLPSYIPSKHFAGAVLDLLAPADGKSRPALDQIAAAAEKLQNERLKNVVLRAVGDAAGDLDKARAAIEDWYDQSMARLTGYYKRWTQVILIGLGLFVAVGLNIDAIAISQQLLRDKAIRSALASEVASLHGQSAADASKAVDDMSARIKSTGVLIGHPDGKFSWPTADMAGALRIAGWLATALAIMLGAPFWFDLINKLVPIRSSLKPQDKEKPGPAG